VSHIISLPNRSIIKISGPDRLSFLQGLITQDINLIQKHPIYSLILTSTGRFFADLFISKASDDILMDVDKDIKEDIISYLSKYKLRSRVSITKCDDFLISYATIKKDDDVEKYINPPFVYADPRLPSMGVRVIHRESVKNINNFKNFKDATFDFYNYHRIINGIPEVSDMDVGKSMPIEYNMDHLNAISWTKGCYIGQELTARTKHQGIIRKRTLPFSIVESTVFEEPTSITQDGKNVGTVKSFQGKNGIAMIRMESLESGSNLTLSCGAIVNFSIPSWLHIS
jgi:folate-binding protein YgfZ